MMFTQIVMRLSCLLVAALLLTACSQTGVHGARSRKKPKTVNAYRESAVRIRESKDLPF